MRSPARACNSLAEVCKVLEMNMEDRFRAGQNKSEFLFKRTKRAKELKEAELEFKQKLPDHMCKLLQNNKLLLMKEILEDLRYPDTQLVEDIAKGFPLTGWLDKSNVFPVKTQRPQYDVETLKMLGRGLKQNIKRQVDELDDLDEVNQQT